MLVEIQNLDPTAKQPIPVKKQVSPGQPLQIKSQPGMRLEISVDGVKQSGKAQGPGAEQLKLKRVGAHLHVVNEQGQTLCELLDFFETPDVTLTGRDWSFLGSTPTELAEIQFTDLGVSAGMADVALAPAAAAPGLLGGAAGGAVGGATAAGGLAGLGGVVGGVGAAAGLAAAAGGGGGGGGGGAGRASDVAALVAAANAAGTALGTAQSEFDAAEQTLADAVAALSDPATPAQLTAVEDAQAALTNAASALQTASEDAADAVATANAAASAASESAPNLSALNTAITAANTDATGAGTTTTASEEATDAEVDKWVDAATAAGTALGTAQTAFTSAEQTLADAVAALSDPATPAQLTAVEDAQAALTTAATNLQTASDKAAAAVAAANAAASAANETAPNLSALNTAITAANTDATGAATTTTASEAATDAEVAKWVAAATAAGTALGTAQTAFTSAEQALADAVAALSDPATPAQLMAVEDAQAALTTAATNLQTASTAAAAAVATANAAASAANEGAADFTAINAAVSAANTAATGAATTTTASEAATDNAIAALLSAAQSAATAATTAANSANAAAATADTAKAVALADPTPANIAAAETAQTAATAAATAATNAATAAQTALSDYIAAANAGNETLADTSAISSAITAATNAATAANLAATQSEAATDAKVADLVAAATAAGTALDTAQSAFDTADQTLAAAVAALSNPATPAQLTAVETAQAALTTAATNLQTASTAAAAAVSAANAAATAANESAADFTAINAAVTAANTAATGAGTTTTASEAATDAKVADLVAAATAAGTALGTAQTAFTSAEQALADAVAALSNPATPAQLTAVEDAQAALTNAASALQTASNNAASAITAANNAASAANETLPNLSTVSAAVTAATGAATTTTASEAATDAKVADLVAAATAAGTALGTAQTAFTSAEQALADAVAALSNPATPAQLTAVEDAQTALTNAASALQTASNNAAAAVATANAAASAAHETAPNLSALNTAISAANTDATGAATTTTASEAATDAEVAKWVAAATAAGTALGTAQTAFNSAEQTLADAVAALSDPATPAQLTAVETAQAALTTAASNLQTASDNAAAAVATANAAASAANETLPNLSTVSAAVTAANTAATGAGTTTTASEAATDAEVAKWVAAATAAGTALGTAQTAFNSAEQALATAVDALSDPASPAQLTAVEDAQTALTNAASALQTASTAAAAAVSAANAAATAANESAADFTAINAAVTAANTAAIGAATTTTASETATDAEVAKWVAAATAAGTALGTAQTAFNSAEQTLADAVAALSDPATPAQLTAVEDAQAALTTAATNLQTASDNAAAAVAAANAAATAANESATDFAAINAAVSAANTAASGAGAKTADSEDLTDIAIDDLLFDANTAATAANNAANAATSAAAAADAAKAAAVADPSLLNIADAEAAQTAAINAATTAATAATAAQAALSAYIAAANAGNETLADTSAISSAITAATNAATAANLAETQSEAATDSAIATLLSVAQSAASAANAAATNANDAVAAAIAAKAAALTDPSVANIAAAESAQTAALAAAGVATAAATAADNAMIAYANAALAGNEVLADLTAQTDAITAATSAANAATIAGQDTTPPYLAVTQTNSTIATDGTINSTERSNGVFLSGMAEAGRSVTISTGTGTHVTVTADGTGAWNATVPAGNLPTSGSVTFTVTSSDAAGNIATVTRTVSVDTQAPNAPTLMSVTDHDGLSRGALADGDTTDDNTPTLRYSLVGSQAVAGDSIQLYNGSTALGSAQLLTQADIDNAYVDVTAPALYTGVYDFNAKLIDAAGNESQASATQSNTILITANQRLQSSSGQADGNFNWALYRPDLDMARLSDGGYVLAWCGYDEFTPANIWAIYVQRYDAQNQPVGEPMALNARSGAFTDQLVQVAALSSGGYVVTWSDYGSLLSDPVVRSQVFDQNSQAVGGMQTLQPPGRLGYDYPPQTLSLAGGGYVLAWQGFTNDGNEADLYVQAYAANGNALGVQHRLSTEPGFDDGLPALTALGDGGFVISWSGTTSDGRTEIFVQRYDNQSQASGSAVQLSGQVGESSNTLPQLATLADGGYVLTWIGSTSDGGSDVFAQRYDANNSPVGGVQRMQLQTGAYDAYASKVAALSDGGYVLVWYEQTSDGQSYDIFIQRFDASNAAVGSGHRVAHAASADDNEPEVVALLNGGYVIAWTGSQDVYVQQYGGNDQPISAPQRLQWSDGAYEDLGTPALLAMADGGYVVSWQGYTNGQNYDVFAQRFDANGLPWQDSTAPLVSSVQALTASGLQNSTLNAGDEVSFTVTFNEVVRVTGNPKLTVNVGGVLVQADFETDLSDGSRVVRFKYIVQPGDNDLDGISIDANSLSLNGGSFKDMAGNDANITHVAVSSNAGYKVDTSAPTATLTVATTANTASATVQSSEVGTAYLVKTGGTGAVTVTDLTSITGADGAKWNSVAISAANSNTSLSLAGLEDGTYTLYTVDAAGNLSNASASSYTVDSTPPTAFVVADYITAEEAAVVQSTEVGTVYLVNSTVNVTNLASITTADGALWNSLNLTAANTATTLPTTGLIVGDYKLYAVDVAGNLSLASTSTLSLGAYSGQSVVDVYMQGDGDGNPAPGFRKLIAPVQVEGKWYYYWDGGNDGSSSAGWDGLQGNDLDVAFRYDINGALNPDATFNVNEVYRYASVGGVKLAVPTYGSAATGTGAAAVASPSGGQSFAGTSVSSGSQANATYNDLLAIWDAYNGTATTTSISGIPTGWAADNYFSATPEATAGNRAVVDLRTGVKSDHSDATKWKLALELVAPTLSMASDTGPSSSDSITTASTINVGNLLAGGTWYYQTALGGAWTQGTGSSFTGLSGTHTYTVRQVDASGMGGNTLARLTATIDTVNPVFSSASVNGSLLTLVFNESMGTTNLPSGAAFIVQVNGATRTVNSVSALGSTVTLTLASAVTSGQAVTVSYTDPTVGNDGNAVQDLAGNDLASLAAQSAVNVTSAANTALSANSLNSAAAGFVINGQSANDRSGFSVSMAGDVNGDGLTDLIVGSPDHAAGGLTGAGRSYVVFGKSTGTAVDLSAIAAGNGGFAIDGAASSDQSGYGVSSVGDINGDGLADLVIGARYVDTNGGALLDAGRSYVVYGKANGTAVNLSSVAAGVGGFVINGQDANDASGQSVFGLGDVNGDGLGDLIIGAPNSDPAAGLSAGRSYVVFGKNNNTAVDLSAVAAGTGGFVINGHSASDQMGMKVSNAGDVNGDGLADVLVSSTAADPAAVTDAGRSYVVFGKTDGTAVDLSAVVAGAGGFVINGQGASDASGVSISYAGDVNGDGLADVIVGAHLADPNALASSGRSYVVFGRTGTSAVNLSAVANGAGGFVIDGQAAGELSGISVAYAGDFNGDGLADLLVGASGATVGGASSAGRAYLVFGKANTAAISLSAVANGVGGFVFNGFTAANDQTGNQVSAAGDVNGDGLADLLVAAANSDPSAVTNAGRTYVIFGNTTGIGSSTFVDQMGTTGNDTLSSTGGQTLVAGAGDDTLNASGADVLYGGAGSDTFVVGSSTSTALQSAMGSGGNALQLSRIDGGGGTDTLRLTGGASLDLTKVANAAGNSPLGGSRIDGIERVDLATDTTANTLKLSLNDVLDMSGMNLFNNGNGWTGLGATVQRHQLVIDGTSADTVQVVGGSNWTQAGTVSSSISGASQTYNVWNHNSSAAQLLMDADIRHEVL